MSKSKTKYRWIDEDYQVEDRKSKGERRKLKKMKNDLRSKNFIVEETRNEEDY